MFRKSLWIAFVFLLGNSALLLCQNDQGRGYLKIETETPGIEILINGNFAGFSGLAALALAPGTYAVTALHPNRHVWGNRDWQREITITPNDTLIISPQFSRRLTIRTTPFDAEVTVNNVPLGKTPLTISLEPGTNIDILIEKPGYRSYHIFSAQIKENFINIPLMRAEKISLEPATSFEKLNAKKMRYRKVAYGLWGASIVSGLATVYLKSEAEDWYDKYLKAGSLADMNHYYRQSQDYDAYTLISLGVLQGCFGLSFYFLIKSL
ncbi:MAG: PEGA domain-containing protein [Candidatus Zhuqueibacterota bacterium]